MQTTANPAHSEYVTELHANSHPAASRGTGTSGTSLFLTNKERELIERNQYEEPLRSLVQALSSRVCKRAAAPGLSGLGATCEWWHYVAEYLTDAAMLQAIKPQHAVAGWLRDMTLSVIRRPIQDWVGPEFRDHESEPLMGHLETSHLSWSVAVVLDLVPGVFTEDEREEIVEALREKGLALCQQWQRSNFILANWRCVLNAGVAVTAAVIDDSESMAGAIDEYHRCVDAFQADGSYSESLQYGNYAGYMLMLAREALIRRRPELASELPLEPWVAKPRWDAASLFYLKPLSGWGSCPRPRSANFNDSAAIYRASADFLLHIAAHARDSHPREAGLARWLFDTLYAPSMIKGPNDRATFGFINDFGFLTFPLVLQATEAMTPQEAGLTEMEAFSCGDVIARDAWEGKTLLATHGGGDALHGPGHLHGDLNSFILVHNNERLLVDPGHCCYRNLVHDWEKTSQTHNTCSFVVNERRNASARPGQASSSKLLEQSSGLRRFIDKETGKVEPPVERGAKRLLARRLHNVSAIGSEAAALYGEPISEYTRWWLMCGSHVIFIVDRIQASEPVATRWSWLLNNRDDELDLKLFRPDRLVARRGDAGMKLFHYAGASLTGPRNAYVHDAYHPRPRQLGEGGPGSGLLVQWQAPEMKTELTAVHAICLDTSGWIGGWHSRQEDGFDAVITAPDGENNWKLQVSPDAHTIRVFDEYKNRTTRLALDPAQGWQMDC